MLPLVILAVAIAVLILLVVWAKVHPFLAFILVSAAAALALGMPPGEVAGAIRKGIGDIFGTLAIVIVTGAMLGRIVVESGAAQRIADTLVAACGRERTAWAMAITGFIVGIPLFYGVGFVLMVPIIFAVIGRYGLRPLVIGMPALASLSVAHGLLPPHPAPTALVAQFNASLPLTLLYGIIIAIPALVLAGPIFGRTLGRIDVSPPPGLVSEPKSAAELPGVVVSFATALLPVLLLLAVPAATAVLAAVAPDDTRFAGPPLNTSASRSGERERPTRNQARQ